MEGVLPLAEALAVLSPREREIVLARRLSDEPRTLEALGAELGVSKERVRQIEATALGRMKGWIERRVGDPVEAGLVG